MKKLLIILTFITINISLLTNLNASTLNLAMSSSPTRVNPILSSDSASSEISSWIFNGLFKYDKDGKITPDLATSYSFESNTELIINLRKGVKWHDGNEFTASDVLFTYNSIHNPKIFTSILSNYKEVKKVEVIDKYTLRIVYKKPYFKALEIWMIGILPKHILKDEKDLMTSSFNKHPIGTGPYKLKGFKVASDIVLSANEDYFLGEAKIKEILYKFVPDETTSFFMLKQEALDVGGLTSLQMDRQISSSFKKKHLITERASFGYTYLGFNLKNKKFQDIRVRQALSLAINRQEMVDILFFGHGQVCNGPFLPGSFAYNEKIKTIIPNIKKAKELLKEAGYDEKNPFTFELITNTGNETRINAAQILQHQLAKAGVKLTIRVMQWQAYLNTVVHPRNFEAVLLAWSLALMPDAYPLWHSNSAKIGAFNLTSYKNKEVDYLIEKGSNTINQDELGVIYKKIFAKITDDLPYLFLYIQNSITVVNKKIQNVQPSFTGVMHNQQDWIKED